jgi:hypothetical protein
MLPPAGRIPDSGDPGQDKNEDLHGTDDDFLAVGPALRILQLNVEGLSAAKRSVISSIAVQEKIDIICLQETHVDGDIASRFTITGFDLVSYKLHAKHGRATYVRGNITEAAHVVSTPFCDVIRVGGYHVANVYKPPSERWDSANVLPVLPHPSVFIGDFNSHHPDWGYQTADSDGDQLQNWSTLNDLQLIHDTKQRGTFHSARWQRDYSPDLCWMSTIEGHPQPASCTVLNDFPHSQHRPSIAHIGLRIPVIRGKEQRRWNFRKADWPSYTDATERSIPPIPSGGITIEEAYTRFTGALMKAAHSAIPRGFRPTYIPCFDAECSALLTEFENSGDPDVADHLIDSLDAARRRRWEESTSQMDYTRSSRKSWALIRRLGAAQRPPKINHPPVKANAVASHLVQVAKAPRDKKFERQVRDRWRSFCHQAPDRSPPLDFSLPEIDSALRHVKPGTAPGYDNIHPEFLLHLGPRARSWLSKFFSRILRENKIPKIWRKAKVIAIEKPGKDPKIAANYRPISLLSVCYKLLERLALQRISPTVESILSPDQAGFRSGRSTCDQVAALTTYIENGYQQQLKTGAVFLDLTAAYDTVWHTGLLAKMSRNMPHWFCRLAELLLRGRRFRVHLGSDVSAWRNQVNGLPQGSVLAPTLFNLYTNDLPATKSRRFIYADDICFGTQAQTFAELECSLSSDMARMADYCYHWRLKPSAAKTVSCVFHLHNVSASRELNVTLSGKRLKHDPHPVYLGVTLDRTLSYRDHLEKTAGKLKGRNNLLMKLAGSSWGADANTLRSSALALCYSVGEYCAPVWARSAHTKLVDVQLNTTMRLVTGTLRPTPLPWLPVLSNIEPPALRRKAAVDKLISKAIENTKWDFHNDIVCPPRHRLTSRRPLWTDMQPVDTGTRWQEDWQTASVVNNSLVSDPAIQLPGFDLPRRQWSMLNRFRTDQGHCRACHKRWGLASSDLCDCGEVQTMSHIVNTCPRTKFDGGLQGLSSADADALDWLDNIRP